MPIQSKQALEEFYTTGDPWDYEKTSDDTARCYRLKSMLPAVAYRRVLDIGCGNGFVTVRLPGAYVCGIDLSERAIGYAKARVQTRADAHRYHFQQASLFELRPEDLGTFDFINITGVLYRQYIGESFSLVRLIVDKLLDAEGILATVHIEGWCPWRFPYNLIASDLSPYRQYIHRTEIFLK